MKRVFVCIVVLVLWIGIVWLDSYAITFHTIQVSWNAEQVPQGFTLGGYYIYQSVNGATFTRVANTKNLSWSQTKAKANNNYCYQVTAFGTEKVAGQPVSSQIESSFLPTPVCVAVH